MSCVLFNYMEPNGKSSKCRHFTDHVIHCGMLWSDRGSIGRCWLVCRFSKFFYATAFHCETFYCVCSMQKFLLRLTTTGTHVSYVIAQFYLQPDSFCHNHSWIWYSICRPWRDEILSWADLVVVNILLKDVIRWSGCSDTDSIPGDCLLITSQECYTISLRKFMRKSE